MPAGADLSGLAEFALNVMEGGVMQARTYRDVAYFDRTSRELRAHFDALMKKDRQEA